MHSPERIRPRNPLPNCAQRVPSGTYAHHTALEKVPPCNATGPFLAPTLGPVLHYQSHPTADSRGLFESLAIGGDKSPGVNTRSGF